MHAVKGLFARENGEGMFFDVTARSGSSASTGSAPSSALGDQKKVSAKKPTLTVVK
jgi:stringent starvation protein B